MLLQDGQSFGERMSMSSGTTSPALSLNTAADDISTDEKHVIVKSSNISNNKMMEERTRSADSRRPHLIPERSIMISKEKVVGHDKKVAIGIRAMSAQERTSLSLKYKVEEDAARLSEQKSKIVKGKSQFK